MSRIRRTPAEIIFRLRKRSKLSMIELAKAASMTRQAVHAIEAGHREPSLKTAIAFVKAMGVSLAVFDKCE